MRKFILFLCLFSAINLSAQSFEVESISNEASAKIQYQVSQIGFNILNSNSIERRTVFYYNTSKIINAGSYHSDRTIVIYRGLYNMLNSEDEIAAVLSHEISHSVDSYDGIMRGFFSNWSYMFAPKKYEYKADKRAVDYMVKAGYNPVAFIVVMTKTFGQQRFDWLDIHPLASRRMMELYEYIYKKYPEYLVNNPYKNDVYYQNFLLTSKQNRAKFKNKVETKSKGSVNYL